MCVRPMKRPSYLRGPPHVRHSHSGFLRGRLSRRAELEGGISDPFNSSHSLRQSAFPEARERQKAIRVKRN